MFLRLERGTVQNLRVSDETSSSFLVSWNAAPGDVRRYRLTYAPVRGDSAVTETATRGPETSMVLHPLQPATTYRVSVAAEYPAGPGDQSHTHGTTTDGG